MKMYLPIAIGTAVGLYLGSSCFAPDPPAPAEPTILMQTPEAVLDSLEAMREEVGSLRSRLAGRDTLRVVQTVWDTVRVPVPDTVGLAFVLDYRSGEAGAVVGIMDSTKTTLRRGTRRYSLPENCDDGIYLGMQGIVCDKAEWGHLRPYVGAGMVWSRRDTGARVGYAPVGYGGTHGTGGDPGGDPVQGEAYVERSWEYGYQWAVEAGLLWQPSWRSRWLVTLSLDASGSGLAGRFWVRRALR